MQPYPHGELVVVLDCGDLERAAAFWSQILGYRRMGEPTGPYLSLQPTTEGAPELLLQRVPEQKRVKNRMHLDLRTKDLDAEVGRAVAVGAVIVTNEPIAEHGWRWYVLADPDGNEFCVLQPPDDD